MVHFAEASLQKKSRNMLSATVLRLFGHNEQMKMVVVRKKKFSGLVDEAISLLKSKFQYFLFRI